MRKGIYQDKSGKWYIHTKIKIDGIYRTCTIRGFYTKKEADENYDKEIVKWKMSHHYFTNEASYESAKKEYLEYRIKKVREESARKDKTQFTSYWDMIFGNQSLTSVFNIERLKIIYDDLVKNTNIKQSKKGRLVGTFIDFAYFCYLTKRINNEVYEDIKIIFIPIKVSKIAQKEKRYIPDDEMQKFFTAIDNKKDYTMFKLFAYLGCRISEFLGICIDCYDKANRKIKIRQQLLTSGKLTTTLKTNNSYRDIPISNEMACLLDDYLRQNNLTGKRLFACSHSDFKRKLKRYEIKANIPLYASHEFRHTKATNLAKRCENMSDVVYCANLLGHSVSMYMNTYINHIDNSLESKFI